MLKNKLLIGNFRINFNRSDIEIPLTYYLVSFTII